MTSSYALDAILFFKLTKSKNYDTIPLWTLKNSKSK